MPPVSYKYLEKLEKEVTDFGKWLAGTQPESDGSARPDDLLALYNKGYSIYQKSLALNLLTQEVPQEGEDFKQLRQDVANFDYKLSTHSAQPSAEELKAIFTRANMIYLKALSLYRAASTEAGEPQEPAGDEPVSLSGA